MITLVTGIPGLLALIVCFRRGPAQALLNVYLPALLLLPDYYRWFFTGHLTFSETAILPIAAFFALSYWRRWKWSVTDFIVVALTSIMTVSEYVNAGFFDARNLFLDLVCTWILPYAVAKGLLHSQHLQVLFAKRVAILLTIVSVAAAYEFKMAYNPYDRVLGPIFPGWSVWVTTFRYGLPRIAGPYGHAILAGMILVAGHRLTRWLDWSGSWPGNVPFLPISKVRFCELWIVAAIVMTLCRGPWVGACVAALAVALGRARNRKRAFALAMIAIALLALPVYYAVKSYVSVSPGAAVSESQETAAYRRELLDKYVSVVEQRPAWGYGRDFPRDSTMSSIDNYYLLLALTHGVYALLALLMLFSWMLARLARFSASRPCDDPSGSLALTLLGVYLAFAVSLVHGLFRPANRSPLADGDRMGRGDADRPGPGRRKSGDTRCFAAISLRAGDGVTAEPTICAMPAAHAIPIRVAYLVSEYPGISHNFILREVRRLRALNFHVCVASINSPDRAAGDLAQEERDEFATTFYVKRAGVRGAAKAHLAVLLKRPRAYFKGLLFALRLAGTDLRRIVFAIFYFGEAVMIGRWMESERCLTCTCTSLLPRPRSGSLRAAFSRLGFRLPSMVPMNSTM
jgi:hypothetical protein